MLPQRGAAEMHDGLRPRASQLRVTVDLASAEVDCPAGGDAALGSGRGGCLCEGAFVLLLSVSQAEGLIILSYSENCGGRSPVSVKQPARLIPRLHPVSALLLVDSFKHWNAQPYAQRSFSGCTATFMGWSYPNQLSLPRFNAE